MKSPQHLERIDVLRGVAILSVMAFHLLSIVYGKSHPGYIGNLLNINGVAYSWWAFAPLSFGWFGVPLFFVISGYVIHRNYLRSNRTWLDFF